VGMEGKLRQISEFELASYRKNPEKFYAGLLHGYDIESMGQLNAKLRAVQESLLGQKIRERALSGMQPLPEHVAEMQRQMQALMSQNPAAQAAMESHHLGLSKDGTQLSLYKSWHCLHFLLTGKSWEPAEPPLGNAITGDAELPDRQRIMGYGPARYLTPIQVREVASALASYPAEEKAEAFDPEFADKQEVYLPQHDKEELLYYFGLLRDFYQDAAHRGHAMLLWVE
jgi:hypothetical protein